MLEFTFELNNKPMSALKCGAISFKAFSGMSGYMNNPQHACLPDIGPIPRGKYLIVDQDSGGFLTTMNAARKGKFLWFALYSIDNVIDDKMTCGKIERGNFRLHPQGTAYGISRGCITLPEMREYIMLRSIILVHGLSSYPGTDLQAYGRVTVI